ncbi:pectate lyase family protein [Streptomyces marincola]|uniref:Pectate lyase n=1 Tax=Streptomyces marincola TaxID=2878388 RepID=A0A1W7CRZ1_9ACTN|nr:pectate lyase [Streptomyces marincola]ARQ67558.1 pectate lyase [Streptomyces marincola]
MRRTSARLTMAGIVAFATAASLTVAAAGPGSATESAAPRTLAVGSPTGFGASTTGGGNGTVHNVSNASQFTSAVQSSGSKQVRVNGTINLSSMVKVSANTTIIGVGSHARIEGSGLNISRVNNVIVQNLTFSNSNDDAINVEYATNVWIDHNTFTNPNDGAVDIKRASDRITVSWNRSYNVDKNMLLGHSDSNGSEDSGKLRVTYHHNWFDGTNQRNPRVRFGNPVHVYNNYFDSVGSYGVASTENAGVLVEGNYFENTDDPFHLGEGSSDKGSLVARNNHFVNSGSGQQGGSVNSIPYGYSLQSASSVKASVTAGAGVGKI